MTGSECVDIIERLLGEGLSTEQIIVRLREIESGVLK